MKTNYIINESVVFDPEEQSLSPYDQPGIEVTLHIPASECLRQLLLHQDEVVSQQFLFEQVWEKNGTYVSASTLYQNIASVRKALKAAGHLEDIIKTVPKVGFKCIANIREIEKVREELQNEVTTATSTEEINKETIAVAEKPLLPGHEKKLAHIIKPFIYIAACLACFVPAITIYLQQDSNTAFFSNYSHSGKVGECELYSYSSNSKKSITIFTGLMERQQLHCSQGEVAYMTASQGLNLASILLCDRVISKMGVQCETYVYKGKGNEE
ncbi:hypothetical protein FH968_10790 [Buttiauxella sp. B2]|uniref:winged helix-turn-helix domain-containing protein n=1 Tax=Buttiauxella sp. B2 TaxID=2587812 RepID=UPI0011242461|nr:winged helix-turn-helix domain-containing protein [Buttiauxella sp. B2]TNV20481.1 hypothetical protein FH968_10790 [Buttiauxella sp. B2]